VQTFSLPIAASIGEDVSMGPPNYAPQRRRLLELHRETSAAEGALALPGPVAGGTEANRLRALSVPDEVRALGEPLEPFFAACGGTHPVSLSLCRPDGRQPPETLVFDQPFVLVGRCPESDLCLPDVDVSFRHFYLQLVAGRWLYVDLAGISGHPGDKGRSTSGWLDVDGRLSAGPYLLTRVAEQPPPLPDKASMDGPTELMVPAECSPAGFVLEVVNARRGRGRGTPQISTPVTLIGASRQCDVWLKDESISRVHASLVLTPRGLWVIDLLGRNGVLVDGRRVYWKQIYDGSIIQVGRFRLRVRFGPSLDLASPPSAGRTKTRSKTSPTKEPGRGSLSEDSVMKLVSQFSEMQAQFFEHSRLQTELIMQMMARLGHAQQVSVRQDLTRIEEIGRELEEIKSQLAPPRSGLALGDENDRTAPELPRTSALRSPADRDVKGRPATGPDDLSVPSARKPGVAQGTDEACSGASGSRYVTSENRRMEEDAGPQRVAGTASNSTADAHALLSQRMAHLAKERNSRWRHVLSVFRKAPEEGEPS